MNLFKNSKERTNIVKNTLETKTDLKKHLKYLISLFAALLVMAGDGVLYSQSNSPEYYQSSFVVSRKEIDLKSLRIYVFNKVKSGRITFSILLKYFKVKENLSHQNRIILKTCNNLHLDIISFIKQSVFVNEIITSSNFKKILYIA